MKKKILSFLLSFVLLISAFPLSAYASSSDFIADYLTFSDGTTSTWDESIVNAWTPNTYLTTAVPGTNFYRVTYTLNSSVNSGDVYKVELIDTLRYAYPYWSGVSNIKLYDPNGHWSMIITPDELRDTDVTNSYGDPYKYYPYVVNADLNGSSNGSLQLCVQFNLNGTTTSYDFHFTFKAKLSCSYDTESGSILNSIIDYIKQIFNSIKELPTKIQSFFTDLKNNMSAWFSDVGEWFSELKDNISAWFSDVGEWFTQLGDNLKQWFDDVGNWFSELFTNISNFFTDLWDGFIEWFKSLFVPRDGYFTELLNFFNEWFLSHFGFLAQAGNVIYSLIETISNLDGTTTGIIIFPEIRLPFLDNPLLMEQQEFDLLSYINSISVLKQIYEIYQVIVTALFIFFFVKYAYRKFEEILKGREVTD